MNSTSSHGLLEPEQRVGDAVRGLAELGGEPVGRELPLRRKQQVDGRRGDRAEDEEQRRCKAPPIRASTSAPARTTTPSV